jgi:hypothetical protein
LERNSCFSNPTGQAAFIKNTLVGACTIQPIVGAFELGWKGCVYAATNVGPAITKLSEKAMDLSAKVKEELAKRGGGGGGDGSGSG